VITGYSPCTYNESSQETPSNTIHHQQSILLQQDGANETMLDANEGIRDDEGGLRKICNKTLLIDTFTLYTGEECDTATYSRGKKRIDYISNIPKSNSLCYKCRLLTIFRSQ
jgi:hypothetical protein